MAVSEQVLTSSTTPAGGEFCSQKGEIPIAVPIVSVGSNVAQATGKGTYSYVNDVATALPVVLR